MARGKRIVVKVGTSTLTGPDGRVDRRWLASLAAQIAVLRSEGAHVVVVSSGAIAAGVEAMHMPGRPSDLTGLQATAAIGQVRLIGQYAEVLGEAGAQIAQVLLTRHDTGHRQAYLFACRTLERLLEMGIVPIVNENDTTAVEEIRFGDNDTLAALVGVMVHADLVVLLTDIEGLYDADPRTAEGAELLEHVDELTDEMLAAAGGAGTEGGSGGMVTKLEAARILMKAGVPMVVCDGARTNVLVDAFHGEPVGTYFAGGEGEVEARKLWIAFARHPKGSVVVDSGATDALCLRGKSLLPAGVVRVEGVWLIGDPIAIVDANGRQLARGLADISSIDLDRIKGLKSSDIGSVAPGLVGLEVVHRDRLVIL
ncbi:MAG: glutamate 5-kinase [Coriobacteriia bacterium]|nr:glutamate 5-kinase [Coriobacteriia bacterium]